MDGWMDIQSFFAHVDRIKWVEIFITGVSVAINVNGEIDQFY